VNINSYEHGSLANGFLANIGSRGLRANMGFLAFFCKWFLCQYGVPMGSKQAWDSFVMGSPFPCKWVPSQYWFLCRHGLRVNILLVRFPCKWLPSHIDFHTYMGFDAAWVPNTWVPNTWVPNTWVPRQARPRQNSAGVCNMLKYVWKP
jgi:hypothetical protein